MPAWLQLVLFADLPIPPDARPRRTARYAVAAPVVQPEQQLCFEFRLRALENDLDTPYDFPVHVLAPATTFERPSAPRSIFDVAAAAKEEGGRRRVFNVERAPAAPRDAIRTGDATRYVGLQYPDNRWTAEREERERARRARQRPPKPTKKAKTRSRKLLELVGEDSDA